MIIFNKYRVTNIKRFRLFLIISTFLLSFSIFMILFSCTKVYSANNTTIYDTIIVREGDTLWGIARCYNNKCSNMNKFIYEIKVANKLDDCIIYPGQELIIPID